jgi:excisionase family DNA binding protein
MEDTLLVPSEVAAILRTRTVTVYAAAKDGRIPCVRIWQGKRRALLRFRREDIEAIVRGRAVGPKGA